MAADDQDSIQGMQVNPQRAAQLLENINAVRQRIQAVSASKAGRKPVRLIAVSKLKPATDILALHRPPHPSTSTTSSPTSAVASTPEPQLHFGENYAQELTEKAALLPRSIRWHFIGALQTNKCKNLAQSVPNLWCVSSVDSLKKAEKLDEGRRLLLPEAQKKSGNSDGNNAENGVVGKEQQANEESEGKDKDKEGREDKLRILVQINTSSESAKSGVPPTEAAALIHSIRASCPHLRVAGLMTIGAIARSTAATPETENEDFVELRRVRDSVVAELGSEGKGNEDEDDGGLELSMGMSADFEGAIALGSDEVRVGTTVFGERPAKKDARVKEETQEEKG